MRRVRITLPATITRLGPGATGLGLAISLHTTVEISERTDTALVVEPSGEGAGRYSIGLRHPVSLGLMRVFQRLERAVLGLNIRIENQIPIASGLGAEAAFLVAGVIGANNLMGNVFSREDVLQIAAQVTRSPGSAITAILGGLTASTSHGDRLVYRSLPVSPLRMVIALPVLDHYAEDIRGALPDRLTLSDTFYNLNQLPLLLEALRAGDLDLLDKSLDDRLFAPSFRPHIPGYDAVVEAARRAGARAVTIGGSGPAILMFTETNHRHLADAVRTAFRGAGVEARVWTVPIDTQGVVISAAQTA